jgi:hypothetical protein
VRDLHRSTVFALRWQRKVDAPIPAIGSIVRTGCKEQRPFRLICIVIAEGQPVQVRHHEHRARCVDEGAKQRASHWIEGVDPAIPGVSHEQGPREGNRAVGGRANDRPGSIEYTFGRDQPGDELAARGEEGNQTEARAAHRITVGGTPLRIGDVDEVVDDSDPERHVARRQ